MWHEIAAWQEKLAHRPDLSAKTIALYTQDARRFATWLQNEHPGVIATEITSIDAKCIVTTCSPNALLLRPSIVRSSA
jgi:hypothetical protein